MKIYDDIPRSEIEIVISRNNEDITLFIPFNNNSVIYNKGNNNINENINKDNIIKSLNVGREGGTYLQYIINNYYTKPKMFMFYKHLLLFHILNQFNCFHSFNKF